MEGKRDVLGEIDRENKEFALRYEAKVLEKDSLRV